MYLEEEALGAAWYLPEERSLNTTEQILDEMCAALGGRAAESIIFNKISTGALSDLEKVTKQAMAMVTIYGLDEKIGNMFLIMIHKIKDTDSPNLTLKKRQK